MSARGGGVGVGVGVGVGGGGGGGEGRGGGEVVASGERADRRRAGGWGDAWLTL